MTSTYLKTFTLAIFFATVMRGALVNAENESDSAQAKIQISVHDYDTLKQVTATVTKMNEEGKAEPVKDVEVHFYIQRSFSPLPIEGENTTTDEQGELTVDFPKNIPGDSVGDVTVIARIEDDDALGTLEATKTVKWGVPVINKVFQERSLASSALNAPWSLVIAVNAMIIGAWSVIIYIIAQLFKLNKNGKT